MDPFERCDELARIGVERGGMLSRLGRFWCFCKMDAFRIRDVHEQLVPLRPNLAQATIHAAMMEQALRGDPIRITILKSRKHGASTWVQALCAYLCAYYPLQRAVTIAHTGESTDEIFAIARRIATHHAERPAEVLYRGIRWADDSSYYSMTAGGAAVGAGGTPSAVHLSEGPKWERNKRETFYNILNALPMVNTTLAVNEFTAKGRDLFFEHWSKAHTEGSGYTPIFLAWYIDDRCVAPVPAGFEVTDEERELIQRAALERITLTPAMLQWRRLKIREIGPDIFRQEYPSTPEEAVQATEGLVLPGLRDCLFDELPFDPALLPRGGDRVGGIDFGFADPQVIWGGFLHNGEVWLTSYYRRAEGLASDHVLGLDPRTTYYCDPSGLAARKEMVKAASDARVPGVSFVAAPRKKHAGEDIVATELRLLITFVSQGRLHIAREIAEQVITEADSYCWDEKTGKPKTNRSEECGHFDSIDALRYLIVAVASPPKRATKQARPVSANRRRQFAGI